MPNYNKDILKLDSDGLWLLSFVITSIMLSRPYEWSGYKDLTLYANLKKAMGCWHSETIIPVLKKIATDHTPPPFAEGIVAESGEDIFALHINLLRAATLNLYCLCDRVGEETLGEMEKWIDLMKITEKSDIFTSIEGPRNPVRTNFSRTIRNFATSLAAQQNAVLDGREEYTLFKHMTLFIKVATMVSFYATTNVTGEGPRNDNYNRMVVEKSNELKWEQCSGLLFEEVLSISDNGLPLIDDESNDEEVIEEMEVEHENEEDSMDEEDEEEDEEDQTDEAIGDAEVDEMGEEDGEEDDVDGQSIPEAPTLSGIELPYSYLKKKITTHTEGDCVWTDDDSVFTPEVVFKTPSAFDLHQKVLRCILDKAYADTLLLPNSQFKEHWPSMNELFVLTIKKNKSNESKMKKREKTRKHYAKNMARGKRYNPKDPDFFNETFLMGTESYYYRSLNNAFEMLHAYKED